jgi:hypothetical protein
MLAIDADSHFVETLDLFERRVDARFRDRAYKVEKDPVTGKRQLVVDNKPLRLLHAEELLSAISGYGQKESGHDLSNFDRDRHRTAEYTSLDAYLSRRGNRGGKDSRLQDLSVNPYVRQTVALLLGELRAGSREGTFTSRGSGSFPTGTSWNPRSRLSLTREANSAAELR